MTTQKVTRDQALEQLERVLSSLAFQGATRSRELLRFLVEETAGERSDRLKEYTIGAEALGKGEAFDPRTDPIVRAEASRLRGRLERYYASDGKADPIVIILPKGSYVPQIQARVEPAEGASVPIAASAVRSASHERLVWLLVGVAAATAAMAIWAWRRPTAQPVPNGPMQFEVELQSSGTLGSDVGTDVVISPDGTRLVFAVRGHDGVTLLATQRLDQATVTELPDTSGARAPFFSPDGAWVGFWAGGSLKKIAIDGGSPVILCDAVDLSGASWGGDGSIIAALSFGKLSRVPSSGGKPIMVADFTSESIDPRWPQVLPGGRDVLFTAVGPLGPNGASLHVLSLRDGKRTVVVQGGTFGRYVADGYLTYVNQGTLFAVPFDAEQPKAASATPTAILTDLSYSATFGFAQFDASNTGTFVYRRSHGRGQLRPTWIEPGGQTRPLVADAGEYTFPHLSSDGGRLALALTESGVTSIWVHDLRTNRAKRLNAAAGEYSPTWSPDGRVLVVGGRRGLQWLAVDGSTDAAALTKSNTVQVPWSFSPNGTRLAYQELNPTTGFDLWTVAVRNTERGLVAEQPEPFLQTPAYETYPAFSPDGRWIAYGSGTYGRWDVYVRPFPDNGASEVRVSDSGGRIPFWTSSGRQLLYRTDDQRIMVVQYSVKGTSFVAEKPREWSSHRLGDTGVISNLDLDRSSGRVMALMPIDGGRNQQSPNHVTIRLNAAEEIRRRLFDASR